MNVPNWWSATLLALAAWRLFHLIAHDDILDRPRRWALRLSPTWKKEGDATGEKYRDGVARVLTCPYCFGLHCSIAVWLLWVFFPTETLFFSVPLALNAGLIGAQSLLSSE